ncbi:outer membrane protein assembly factor BamA [Luteolibacter pohnpeiensis]|uniref:Outer membrane protein assembly factor BamA n=1 Tax=Luteolibacter pohnpeiensis TaxID=454153 RepID=A0A934S5A0_9BACT|nr:outer membrane protein assembly factor BamA [Luteolibacter pohnpeiensis]MBK1882118.1 outer membrane protein assembly factor BamA [Luteolibacter pohnpeiensis]
MRLPLSPPPLVASGLGQFAALTSISVLALAGTVHAQDFEGKTISEVAIRYRGVKTVDESRLRNFISSKAGTPYRTEKLDDDIKALYNSGLVTDIRWLAEPVGDQVKLIAEVTTQPSLHAVGFLGNSSSFKDQTLAKESKLKAGGPLSDAEILEARRNIEKYYQGYGYPDVTVTHRFQPSSEPGSSDLIFVIDEGLKNEIRHIRFEGNKAFTTPELKKEMKVKEKGWFSWLTKSGRFESSKLGDDVEAVLDYYRSKGYLRASSPGIRREPVGDGRVDLIIPINEGEKYTVKGVSFGKMTVFKPDELYPALTLNGNDAYSSKKMRADVTMIRSYYGSRGYADAQVRPEITDAGPNQVNIKYFVTEGSRFRVGQVHIEGNTKTKDKVIRREIPLEPGDWFNSVELETTKNRLTNLQYFSEVQATGSPGGSGYRDVNVLVEEKSTGTVGVGVGFSSIDSVVGFLNLEQANFDLFNPWNFTGGGQRFAMNLRLGSERTDFSISLTEPWFMDKKLALGGELFYRQSDYFSDEYQQTNVGAAISLRKPLTEKSSVKLEYRLENIDIDVDSDVPVASVFHDDDGKYVRSAVSLDYIYDNRDSTLLPRVGHRFDASASLAGGPFGGDVDTFTLSLRGQKYWNLKWDSIFSINGELAFVDSVKGDRVPVFDRLFLGGGRTLRGFEFRDVGPRDNPGGTDEAIGGKSLGYVSFEYTVPIIETVRAAVFYDTGFVNSGAWDPAPDDLYSDVGIGIRLTLPAISQVPLALDYAVPVSSPDDEADKGGQFNFYLNYGF